MDDPTFRHYGFDEGGGRTARNCGDIGAVMRKVQGLVILGALALASCAAPDRQADHPTASLAPDQVLAVVRDRAISYPEVTLSDYTVNESGASACAFARIPNKPPHVVRAFMDGERLRVSGPFLMQPGSWELPANVKLSEHAARRCRIFGSALPGY
ncbi:hypothetical protein [Brevundimonas sp.]|uniref:hypothetical protein n=1 Tax=Brevundimonas sp. TaxID=1871086 RepID=UPI0025B853EF|nr:hypothetical protein [Brevundimonas sp.]